MNYTQNLFSLLWWHLLSVTRVCHWFAFIVLKFDVPQLAVWHVFHVDPSDLKLALPLVLGPDASRLAIVNW